MFADHNRCHPLNPPVEHIVNFLAEIHAVGRSKSTIVTAKNAVLHIVELATGVKLNSPILDVFMQGVSQLQPIKPRLQDIWNPSIVLRMYDSDPSNHDLTLLALGRKAVTLTALASGQRVQTLAAINVPLVKDTGSVLTCHISSRMKQTKDSKTPPVIYLGKFHNPQTCVYSCVKQYMARTAGLRVGDQLFITSTAPHKPVATGTISSWIKCELTRAGIDTSLYTAHSTRSAATSKAAESLPIEKVLEAADWTGVGTFAKFYNRKVRNTDAFMNAVWA